MFSRGRAGKAPAESPVPSNHLGPGDMPTQQDDPRLAGWYHTVELGGGLVSKGVFDLRPVVNRYGIPESLAGMEVLEVATGDGFFAFEMERRGADRVVAIDVPNVGDCDWLPRMRPRIGDFANVSTWPDHFRMAHRMRHSKVVYQFCSVYDLSPYTVGTFDLVFCGSLLLHLQNPLRALQAIRSVVRTDGMAIVETAIEPEMEEKFPGRCLIQFGSMVEEKEPGEHTVYWAMTTAALEKMLLYAGFDHMEPQGSFLLPPSGPTGTAVVARPSAPSA